ncbi:MAG: stage II sporulation protein M [Methanomicrobiales archaeon]
MSEWRLSRTLLIALVIFVVSLAVGVVITVIEPSIGQNLLVLFKDAVVDDITGYPAPLLFVSLFLNNFQACLLLFLGGATFGVVTLFILLTNGLIIGSIVELVREQQGTVFVFVAILPHGIFEIPAFILSGALGLLLAKSLWNEWNGAGDAVVEATHHGLKFITYVIPLVLLAAFVEAFITPEIIRMVT